VSLKFVEVLIIVCAGALFVWWQFRDLRVSRDETRKQREALDAARQVSKPADGSGPEASPERADGP